MSTSPITITAIPAFNDNYIWLIHNGSHAVVVDPGDAAPVLSTLDNMQLSLSAILVTHHHHDHTGGIADLLKHQAVPVYGPANEVIPRITIPLKEGAQVVISALGLSLSVIETPGHTLGHICFYTRQLDALFCGDTLFGAGCGRLFEGTPAQMQASLAKLAALPPETAVFCAHEYTLSNLAFAQAVDASNPALASRLAQDQSKRAQGISTIPSTIGMELQTNPFLRTEEKAIITHLQQANRLSNTDKVAVFAALRAWKNVF
jgi:hydroxyacylglutathione hydrolase